MMTISVTTTKDFCIGLCVGALAILGLAYLVRDEQGGTGNEATKN